MGSSKAVSARTSIWGHAPASVKTATFTDSCKIRREKLRNFTWVDTNKVTLTVPWKDNNKKKNLNSHCGICFKHLLYSSSFLDIPQVNSGKTTWNRWVYTCVNVGSFILENISAMLFSSASTMVVYRRHPWWELHFTSWFFCLWFMFHFQTVFMTENTGHLYRNAAC